MIDIVTVNYKTYPMLQKLIDSYFHYKTKVPDSHLTIIDNESDREQLMNLKSHDSTLYAFRENLGYAKACNYGASKGDGKYILLLNSDVEFTNKLMLCQCFDYMEKNPDVGIVGPFQFGYQGHRRVVTNAGILGPGSKPSHRGWLEPDKGQYRFNEDVLMVMGSVMFIRREAWDAIASDPIFRSFYPDALGAMPEHELYYEDTALCYAMPKFGYRVVYLGEAEIMHRWHQTIKDSGNTNKKFQQSRKQFRALMDAWGIEHD